MRLALLMGASAGLVFACSVVNSPDDPLEPGESGGGTGNPTSTGVGASSTTTSSSMGGSPPGCGDSVIEGAETCDDGNTMPDDGCDAQCGIEGTCATPREIVLMPQGNALSGTVSAHTGGESQVDTAMCGTVASGIGSDRVYQFEVMDASRLRATAIGNFDKTLRIMTAPCDVAMQVSGGCTQASSDASVNITALAAGTYYAVVDSENTDMQSFNLTVELTRPTSCAEIAQGGLADGPYTIDNGGLKQVYCAAGITYEAFGFAPFNQGAPGFQLLGVADLQSPGVQQAFIWYYNTSGGLQNLLPGWNSNNCCFRVAGSPDYLHLGGVTANERVFPNDQNCAQNCNGSYVDPFMRFRRGVSGVCEQMLPANYFMTFAPMTAPGCIEDINPGLFVLRY